MICQRTISGSDGSTEQSHHRYIHGIDAVTTRPAGQGPHRTGASHRAAAGGSPLPNSASPHRHGVIGDAVSDPGSSKVPVLSLRWTCPVRRHSRDGSEEVEASTVRQGRHGRCRGQGQLRGAARSMNATKELDELDLDVLHADLDVQLLRSVCGPSVLPKTALIVSPDVTS